MYRLIVAIEREMYINNEHVHNHTRGKQPHKKRYRKKTHGEVGGLRALVNVIMEELECRQTQEPI